MTPDAVRAALASTVAARSARVRFTTEQHVEEPLAQAKDVDDSGLPLAVRMFRRVLGAGMRRMPRSTSADGVVDFVDWRCALDYGSFATVIAGDRQWSGRSGRALDTLPAQRAAVRQPLWLLRALEGAEAELPGDAVAVDLVALEQAGRDLALPDVQSVEEARRLPFEVALGAEGRLARVAHTSRWSTISVELFEYGVELPADWSRLPAWATP